MSNDVVVDLFVSVDGWAGSDGLPPYFGYLGPELQAWIDRETTAPQIALMGRVTYEVLAGIPEEYRDGAWHRMAQQDTLVFSRTLDAVDWPNATVSPDLLEAVRAAKSGSDVPLRTVGSLSIARQLLEARLVDRLRLMVFPLLAGSSGREAAFAGAAAADLAVTDHRLLDRRVVLLEYRPTGADIPRVP